MMVMESLWPRLDDVTRNVPFKILREQADLFNGQMQGVLRCDVEKHEYIQKNVLVTRTYDYEADMFITSSALPGYRLSLLEVYFSIAKAYPCEVCNCLNDMLLNDTANNSDEFKNILRKIFNSKETISALENIAAQSQL